MFAVIKTGGKQYRVAQDDLIVIEKLAGAPGERVVFDDVLMLDVGEGLAVGTPIVDGARVVGEIEDQRRGEKVIIFKKKRRSTYKRRRGHRQYETVVKITHLLEKGAALEAAPAKTAVAPEAFPAAEAPAFLSGPQGEPDDLSLIGGVGAVIAKKLNAAGVYHFWQIAELTQAQEEALEAQVGFKGRIDREDWRGQARDLIAGKGPRAKVDQEAAAKAHEAEPAAETAAAPKKSRAKKAEASETPAAAEATEDAAPAKKPRAKKAKTDDESGE